MTISDHAINAQASTGAAALPPRLIGALALLEQNSDNLIADLSRLIAVDTCFPPGDSYSEFADLLEELSADFGGTSECVLVPEQHWKTAEVYGPRNNLIRIPELSKENRPCLGIYFHTDTAPVGTGWTRPALQLTQEGDKFYGRGSADMKGAIAAVFTALRVLAASGLPLAFRPLLLFCTDEEGGLFPGIRYLAEQGRLNGIDALLNLNGSAQPRIWAGCFGSLDLRFQFVGRAAHSGAPGDGINAIEQSLSVLSALLDLQKKIQRRISTLPPPPGAEPLHARLSITSAHGGVKGSALPGVFDIIVNRRYLPEEDEQAVIDEIKTAVADAVKTTNLLNHSMEVVGHLPPVSNPDGPCTPRWTAAQSHGFEVPLEQFSCYGSSTSSDFGWVQRAGIQHMLLGGLARPQSNVHGPDEHTTYTDLLGLARSVLLMLSSDFAPSS